jgi:hypothetical protein
MVAGRSWSSATVPVTAAKGAGESSIECRIRPETLLGAATLVHAAGHQWCGWDIGTIRERRVVGNEVRVLAEQQNDDDRRDGGLKFLDPARTGC